MPLNASVTCIVYPQRTLLFVKYGKYSGTNSCFETMLRRCFSDFEIITMDAADLLRRKRLTYLFLVLKSFMHGLPSIISTRRIRDAVNFHFWYMPITFRVLGHIVRKSVRKYHPGVLFTIQTQSLWSSKTEQIPNFIYTDSSALANIYFRSFPFKYLPSGRWLAQERAAYEAAHRVFVCSNHVKRSLIEQYHLPADKIINIGVGANVDSLPAGATPAHASNKTIIFVGVEWERKGGPILLDAFDRLPERHKDASLLIVGCSPKIGVDNCTIVGRVSASEISSYYMKSSIFSVPTVYEPFGIAFIEAMLYSVTVVAPKHGAMPDYIQHHVTGMLHDPDDAMSVCENLTYLLDHPLQRRAMAINGHEFIRRTYTWDVVGRKLRAELSNSIGKL